MIVHLHACTSPSLHSSCLHLLPDSILKTTVLILFLRLRSHSYWEQGALTLRNWALLRGLHTGRRNNSVLSSIIKNQAFIFMKHRFKYIMFDSSLTPDQGLHLFLMLYCLVSTKSRDSAFISFSSQMHLEGITTLFVWPCLVLTAPLAKLMHLWCRTAYWNERETSKRKAVGALFHEGEFYGGEGACKTHVGTKRTEWDKGNSPADRS